MSLLFDESQSSYFVLCSCVTVLWGFSSNGRAIALHAIGRGIDALNLQNCPPTLHFRLSSLHASESAGMLVKVQLFCLHGSATHKTGQTIGRSSHSMLTISPSDKLVDPVCQFFRLTYCTRKGGARKQSGCSVLVHTMHL